MRFNLCRRKKHLYLRKMPLYYDKALIFALLYERKQMKNALCTGVIYPAPKAGLRRSIIFNINVPYIR